MLSTRAFQAYGEIDLLDPRRTAAGELDDDDHLPDYGTDSIITNDIGLQSAVAVLLFGVLLVLSVVQLRRHRTTGALRVS